MSQPRPNACFFQKMIISKVLIWPWTLIIKVDQCSYGSCVKRRAKLALQQSRYSHFQVQKIKKLDFDEFFEVESSCLWGSLETYSDPLYACKRSISYSYIYSLCLRLTTPALLCTKSFGGTPCILQHIQKTHKPAQTAWEGLVWPQNDL